MPNENLERMIQLANEYFDMQNDPEQVQVGEHVIERMMKLHPACVAEKRTRKGPVAWVLVFPTSHRLMERFIANELTERELFNRTRAGRTYDAVYLCTALVLPEYQRKGIAQRLTLDAIKAIRKDHPITSLFYWPFSSAGGKLAEAVAEKLRLPLYKKEKSTEH